MLQKDYATLVEMLAARAAGQSGQTAFTYEGQPTTYGELWQAASAFAAHLQALGVGHGDRAILVLPNGAEFFTAFYGTLRAGGTAVPIHPGSGAARVAHLARFCAARVVVVAEATTPAVPPGAFRTFQEAVSEASAALTTVSSAPAPARQSAFPTPQPDDIAFIQFTSGSTGSPKGVQLSHANLLTNIVQMIAGMQITPQEIFVSWLPVYHDMGLILKTLVPFYLGAQIHLLPTSLTNVRTWLEAIQQHRATFTAAPDFAYRLCLRRVNPGDYDLSSLRVALNAAEPVRHQTIQDFEAAFGLQNVMVAGYGLAEATVGVSMGTPNQPPRVTDRGLVSVGSPFPGVAVQIVENGAPLPPNTLGEIAIHSQANARGYLNNPTATAAVFHPPGLAEGFLLSGDLGFVDADQHLYIISRQKNILKLWGQTISPHELEEIVEQHPAVRYAVALGIDKGETASEQVYIFAEVRAAGKMTPAELFETAVAITQMVHAQMGFRPGRVYLVKPRTVPLTHNGKVQHQLLKERYLDGTLRASHAILFPEY